MHIVLETPGGMGLYLSFNVFGWLIATLLISLGIWQITLKKKIVTSKLQLYSLLGFICLCVPMFYGSEFSDNAISRLLGLAGGLLLLFSLYQFDELRENPQQVLWWILIAVAIQACFGLAQYFILEEGDWGGYKLGISRPHGSFLQPNVMASFMATGVALSLYLRSEASFKSHHRLKDGLIYLALFGSCFLIVHLFSRTGYLAMISATLLLLPYLFTNNKKQFIKALSTMIFSILLAQISLPNTLSNLVQTQIKQSTTPRSDIYSITSQMILNKPISGHGYGNFERSYLDFNNKLKRQKPELNKPLLKLSHPHNEILYWTSEGGAIAILAMIFFIIAYMKSWLKISNNIAKRLAILGLIMPLLLHSQFEFPFYSSVSHWFIFIILLWFTDIQSNSSTIEFPFGRTFLLRFIAILSPMIFLPFLVTTLHTAHIIVDHEKHGYQNIERLLDIVNPIVWQDRLETNIYAHTLISGLREQNPQALQRYINWGLKRVRHEPRSSIYSNILLCLGILQQEAEYQRVLNEAKLTYPLVEEWGIDFLKTAG